MEQVNTYEYATKDFVLSWANDGGLNIKRMGYFLNNPDVKESLASISPRINMFELNETVIGLRIYDFDATMKSHAGGLVFQRVLGYLNDTFRRHEDQREQLVLGLRYFVLANHYKLLVPQDVANTKVKELYKTYKEILARYPKHYEELLAAEENARELHINEPLVGTTGFMAYPTLHFTWLISETPVKHKDLPEYLYSVDVRHNQLQFISEPLSGNLFKGSQIDCIKYVMDEQFQVYGLSLETLVNKRNENEQLKKMLEELEIVLRVPEEETWSYKVKQQEKQEELEEASAILAADLGNLNLKYATKESKNGNEQSPQG